MHGFSKLLMLLVWMLSYEMGEFVGVAVVLPLSNLVIVHARPGEQSVQVLVMNATSNL